MVARSKAMTENTMDGAFCRNCIFWVRDPDIGDEQSKNLRHCRHRRLWMASINEKSLWTWAHMFAGDTCDSFRPKNK